MISAVTAMTNGLLWATCDLGVLVLRTAWAGLFDRQVVGVTGACRSCLLGYHDATTNPRRVLTPIATSTACTDARRRTATPAAWFSGGLRTRRIRMPATAANEAAMPANGPLRWPRTRSSHAPKCAPASTLNEISPTSRSYCSSGRTVSAAATTASKPVIAPTANREPRPIQRNMLEKLLVAGFGSAA